MEFHVHGGRAVVGAVESALGALPGFRAAEPGEFTRRALLNGRIDLTEAEGLGDLLAAETEMQRRAAIAVAEGGLRGRIDTWCDRLVGLAAQIEAAIDFSDEDDVPEVAVRALSHELAVLCENLTVVVEQPPSERVRDGLKVVIAGPPNSGKSSLLNAMAERDAAIVSPISGTTRDRIEVPVARNGVAYVLTDTAGLLASTDDAIERIGISRARKAIDAADILLWLGDAPPPRQAVWVHPRADVPGRSELPPGRALTVSALTGFGLDQLWGRVGERAQVLLPPIDAIAINRRQGKLIADARDALLRCKSTDDLLLVSEEIRVALRALHQITGHADVEAVLDALFGTFCIGK